MEHELQKQKVEENIKNKREGYREMVISRVMSRMINIWYLRACSFAWTNSNGKHTHTHLADKYHFAVPHRVKVLLANSKFFPR